MNKELDKVYRKAHAEIDGKSKEFCVPSMIQPLHPIWTMHKDAELIENKSEGKYPKTSQNN